MEPYKSQFLEVCLQHGILRFGEFKLKSGRISPYFFNAGLFNDGRLLQEVGSAYAHLLSESITSPYMLYGPAYKGIPLASVTALQLSALHNQSINYAFNRKEEKDHGEGGSIVGASLQGDVVVIDDVITAGTSVRESVDIINQNQARLAAVVIALDRQEVAPKSELSAVQEVEQFLGVPVFSILKLSDLISHLELNNEMQEYLEPMKNYQSLYGAKA